MRKFAEGNFSVSVDIHATDNSVDIRLLDILLEFTEEFSYGFKIDIAMLLLINHSKGGHSTKVNLALQSLLFLFNFKMIVNFSLLIKGKISLTSQTDVTIRILGERATYSTPCN